MAFGTTGVIDDFDRANSANLGANWTTPLRTSDITPIIDTNSATNGPGTSLASGAYYSVATYGPDMEAFADLTPSGADLAQHQVYVRVTGSGATACGYEVIYTVNVASPDSLRIGRVDNGVVTFLSSTFYFTNEILSGDFIGIEAIGTTISAYFKRSADLWGNAYITLTDSTYTAAGAIAIRLNISGAAGIGGRFRSLRGGTTTSTAPPVPTFPTTSLLDDFNRADGALGANWSNKILASDSANMSILSNTLRGSDATSSAYWSASQFGPDIEAYLTYSTASSSGTYIYAKMQNPNVSGATDGYILGQTASVFLLRIDNDVNTSLTPSISLVPANGDSLGIRIEGSRVSLWYKPSGGVWTERAASEDSTYTSAGYIGIKEFATALRFDDFGGGTKVPLGDAAEVYLKLCPSSVDQGPGDFYNIPGLFDETLLLKAWF